MTDEERKAWEELVEICKTMRYGMVYPSLVHENRQAILAADAELKGYKKALNDQAASFMEDILALRARCEVLEKVAGAAGVLVERIEKGDFREDDGRNFKGNPFVIDTRAALDALKEG
jgi:hypothetical protein